MDVNRAPESVQRELAIWAIRETRKLMRDPETRKEFEAWEAKRKGAHTTAPEMTVRREI